MTVLLAFVTVAALGTWIPLAQLLPGTPERSRVFYVAVGNVVFAGIALLVGGAGLVFDWRGFWLPLAGGVVWTAGNYCVFRAVGDDRARASCRDMDAAQHRCRVRLGRFAVR